jgi:hypothetical protein
MGRFGRDRHRPGWQSRLLGCLLVGLLWLGLATPAVASLHTYRERPGQVTVRSRLSLRDETDRAWQAIAFCRTEGVNLQGIYLRLVGFPGNVQVDRQAPLQVTSVIGQKWLLPWSLDPQTPSLPDSVGQFDLEPLLQDLERPFPLMIQVRLTAESITTVTIAPFVVREWLELKRSLPAPVPSALRK